MRSTQIIFVLSISADTDYLHARMGLWPGQVTGSPSRLRRNRRAPVKPCWI